MGLHKNQALHKLFRFSIALKAINGVIEVIIGAFLLFISSQKVVSFVQTAARQELIENPHDFISAYFFNLSQNFSLSTQHFVAIYLLVNGIIKIVLIAGLWRGKTWAYPTAGIALSLLVGYSIFRVLLHFSFILLIMIIVDMVILMLLHFEYERTTNSKSKNHK